MPPRLKFSIQRDYRSVFWARQLTIALIRQVERIGVFAGHLPKAFPFAPPTSLLPPTDDVLFDGSDGASSVGGDVNSESPTRSMISSRELLEAMADKTLFDELYTALTERVLEAYDACGRRRQASRLRGSLAAMEQ